MLRASCLAVLVIAVADCVDIPKVAIDGKWTPAEYLDGPNGEKPFPPELPAEGERTIHVLISAYRDKLCGRTLFELFHYAAKPELVSVGVVEQYREGDVRCLERYCELMKDAGKACLHQERIRLKVMAAGTADGPMHARSFSGELLRDEEFCLQVDAHTTAVNNWDLRLVAEWEKTENEFGVLSTYMQRTEDMKNRDIGSNINNWFEVPIMCNTERGSHGMARNSQAYAAHLLTKPLRSCFWGAGLSFGKCHMEKRVPHDPFTQGVFDGEEFTRAIRLWTHGYDVYAPSRSLLFHDYTVAQSDPKKWHNEKSPEKAYSRLRGFLGLPDSTPEDMGVYGYGKARTKEAFEEMCGLNLARGPLSTGVPNCGRRPFIPFNREDMIQLADSKVKEVEKPAKLGEEGVQQHAEGKVEEVVKEVEIKDAKKEEEEAGKMAQPKLPSVHPHAPLRSAYPWPVLFFGSVLIFIIIIQFSPRLQYWCRYILSTRKAAYSS